MTATNPLQLTPEPAPEPTAPGTLSWADALNPPNPTPTRTPLELPKASAEFAAGGRVALAGLAAEGAGAPEGSRDDTLNHAAFRAGQLIPHAVTLADARDTLRAAGLACGLPAAEVERVLRDTSTGGLIAGQQEPRFPAELPADVTEVDPDELLDPATGEVLDVPTIADRVFTATPTLATIRQAAHARLVVPWAVLGAALARVVAEVPPHVVLPPVVGSDASLNFAVALVADSGGGKSGAMGCAADVVYIPHRLAQDIGPGSGEGLMMTFLQRNPETKENELKPHPLALLTADEVAQIGVVQGRASQATFGATVRTMLTGGSVATTAVDSDRRRLLRANSYRLCVVSGVQPRLADVLLADADAGTPQRWLWLPATDPGWDVLPPAWPGAIRWEPPTLPRHDSDGRVRVELPEHARAAIVEARLRRIRDEGDPLDGHRLLLREKVAAALAILHGGAAITDQWWELAGLILHVSDVTRARCAAALADKATAEHRARGRLDVAREDGAREARTHTETRCARSFWEAVASDGGHSNSGHKSGAGCSRRCLTRAVRKRADPDKVADLAVDLGWVEVREADGVPRYFPGESRPADDRGRP